MFDMALKINFKKVRRIESLEIWHYDNARRYSIIENQLFSLKLLRLFKTRPRNFKDSCSWNHRNNKRKFKRKYWGVELDWTKSKI